MDRNFKKIVILASMASLVSFVLCGCRESDEIKKIVYTADASETDDTEVLHPEYSEKRNQSSTKRQENKKAEPDTKEVKAKKSDKPTENKSNENGKNSDDISETNKDSHADSRKSDAKNSSGNGKSNSDNNAEKINEGEKGDPSGTKGGKEEGGEQDHSDIKGDGKSGKTTNKENGEKSAVGIKKGKTSDDADARQIVDENGNLVDIPADVKTIAAPGEAGVIVQMLGGKDCLVATSKSLTSNQIARKTFSDEDFDQIETVWEDDGTSKMSDSEFEKLLTIDPDCCITISGQNSFSTKQIKTLKEKDIAYVTIKPMDNAYDIEENVKLIGDILDNHRVGDTTSKKLSREYVKWEQALCDEVAGAKGYFSLYELWDGKETGDGSGKTRFSNKKTGKFTNIIWDWDDDFSYVFYENRGRYVSQNGGAVLKIGLVNSPITYYLNVAAVEGTYHLYSNSKSLNGSFVDTIWIPTYYILSGNSTGPYLKDGDKKQYWSAEYTDMVISPDTKIELGSNGAYYIYHKGEYYCCAFGRMLLKDDVWLGDEKFPSVIAASQKIKKKMEESIKNEEGLYRITPDGIPVDGLEKPYPDSRSAKNVVNAISLHRKSYDIYVNPSGVGDWLNGSVESCLESIWASYVYYGNDTYSKSKVTDKIKEFYSKFYRCDSIDVNSIWDGKES